MPMHVRPGLSMRKKYLQSLWYEAFGVISVGFEGTGVPGSVLRKLTRNMRRLF